MIKNHQFLLFVFSQDEENCLIFKDFRNENEANEMQQMIVENALRLDKQFISILPNCRDWIMVNVKDDYV